MSNLRPTPSAAKKAIIDFSRSQVSTATLKALDLVLSQCCVINATAVVTCDLENGNYIVTITLDRGVFFGGAPAVAYVTSGGNDGGPIVYTDGQTTLVFNNQSIDPGQTSVTISIVTATGGQTITPEQVDMPGEAIALVGYIIPGISVTLPVC